MDLTIHPRPLCGTIKAISSKSQAHRILICAAFSAQPTTIECADTNEDIDATVECLNALGACITRNTTGFFVQPLQVIPQHAVLNCKESGSTLRFMLPICGALGVDTTFLLSGRLPYRPLSPLWEEMERMGCTLSKPAENTIHCSGKLSSGKFTIAGNISSQFITGLLFAAALLPEKSQICITGKLESKPYVSMTQEVLKQFGVNTANYEIACGFPFASPKTATVEGDWSNGAFFLAANALGNSVSIQGLCTDSLQGDRAAFDILPALNENICIDAADIPDLVPILAVVAGAKKGATFYNIGRLRLKESDRVQTTAALLSKLGASVDITENSMKVIPGKYHKCVIDAAGDHRIAMSAAIAATIAAGPVTILGAQCVSKSYPDFWQEYQRLGGSYVQYLR